MANTISITSDTIIKLVIRRGLDSERRTAELSPGELGYTTDTERVFVGDGFKLGGNVVGNLGLVSTLGKENFKNPLPGDFVFERFDKNGSETNILYALSENNEWVNIHPRYESVFDYATGRLNFNSKYLYLNASNGNFGIGTTSPTALLDVNGTASFTGDATMLSNAVLPNLPTLGTHAVNKFYTDSKFVPLTGKAGITNYITFDVTDDIQPALSIIQRGTNSAFRVDSTTGGAPLIIDSNGRLAVGGNTQSDFAVSVYGTLTAGRVHADNEPRLDPDLTNKRYVDRMIALSSTGLKGYLHLNFLPLSGGTVGPLSATSIEGSPALYVNNAFTGPQMVVKGNGSTFIINNNGTIDTNNDVTVVGNISASNLITSQYFYALSSIGIGNGAGVPVAALDIRGDVNIGDPGLAINNTSGNRLTFNGTSSNPSNTDIMAFYRHNVGVDVSELRAQIGDNTSTVADSFVVGNIQSGGTVWSDWLRVRFDDMTHRGNIIANGQGRFSTTYIGSAAGALQYAGGTDILFGSPGRGSAITNRAFVADTNNTLTINFNSDFSGGVKIGSNLNVSGVITATGDVIAFQTSDQRLKTNIKPIESALEKIESINGIEYDWNNDLQSTHTGHDIGVLAQEIEKVLPEAVTTREDGYKAVRYEKVIPLLIQAIKELKEQVASKQ